MKVINNQIYRDSTKVILKYTDNIIVDGWIQDSDAMWLQDECKICSDLHISIGVSKLKKTKDIFLKRDIINKIYFGLQVLKIKKGI